MSGGRCNWGNVGLDLKIKPRGDIVSDVDANARGRSPTQQWHLHIPPETYGPYSIQQMRDYAREGRMNAETLVWTEGADGWARAGDQPALKPLFAVAAPVAAPPPMAKPAAARPAATSYVLGASGALASTGAVAASEAGGAPFRDMSGGFAATPAGRGVGFREAVRICLKEKYFGFAGRAPRSEFWWFGLFMLLVAIVIYGVAGTIAAVTQSDGTISTVGLIALGVAGLVELAFLAPAIAVSVRRLHDLGWSGWWYLAQFIPFLGGLVALVMFIGFLMRGNVGSNKYGPDPLGGGF